MYEFIEGFLLGWAFAFLVMTYFEIKRIEKTLRKMEAKP